MPKTKGTVVLPLEKEEIIKDYRLAYQSRQASLIGRREVLSGKAKFGIFGDGKELPVATPPNTIVFGSGQVSVRDMARAGIILDLIAVVLIVVAVTSAARAAATRAGARGRSTGRRSRR